MKDFRDRGHALTIEKGEIDSGNVQAHHFVLSAPQTVRQPLSECVWPQRMPRSAMDRGSAALVFERQTIPRKRFHHPPTRRCPAALQSSPYSALARPFPIWPIPPSLLRKPVGLGDLKFVVLPSGDALNFDRLKAELRTFLTTQDMGTPTNSSWAAHHPRCGHHRNRTRGSAPQRMKQHLATTMTGKNHFTGE